MKKLFLVAVLLLGFSVMAMAEDVPAVEVFGGYSYVRINPNASWDADSVNMNGWNFSGAFNANKWAGFVVDFGGYYGTMNFPDIHGWADLSSYSIMVGPKVAIRKGKITPFVQALFGLTRIKATESGEDSIQRDFSMALGGGVDVNVSKMIAVRPVQVEYFGVRENNSGDFLNNFRYSAGFVFKLGSR
jgi:opacity protein-like surface antigen